jgi:hypothetical protein
MMTKPSDAMAFLLLIAAWFTYGLVRFGLSFVGLSVADQVALAMLTALVLVAGTILNVIKEATARILDASSPN